MVQLCFRPRPMLAVVLGVSALATSALFSIRAQSATDQGVDFQKDVQPVFQASCYPCHSAKIASGDLRLDKKSLALQGGVSGRPILPGKSGESLLLRRLTGEDKGARMPLGGAPLPPDKIALIRRWIDQGAQWPEEAPAAKTTSKHWAYVKPVAPPVPAVADAKWVRNPIDNFVLARLEREKLSPSPEASKETLIRRLSLDLTGLPPSIAEVSEFVSDQSSGAYTKLVERLLASPHYGERWARPWLDMARYADTNGYEADRRRTIWKYRDWVIQAFNRDMPFDEFTIEQIAGDMLPHPSNDQLIATGFHRNTMFNEEGGVDKEEAHWTNLVDRVNTTATVWLGSTIACAQCHNHKFDPFTQREYYQLLAFFDNGAFTVKTYGDTSNKYIEPQLEMPTPEQEARRVKLNAEIGELETRIKTQTPELDAEQAQWERAVHQASSEWQTLAPAKVASSGGSTLTPQQDHSILAGGSNPAEDTYTIEAKLPAGRITAVRLETLPHKTLPRGGPGRDAYGNFFLSEVALEMEGNELRIKKAVPDDGRMNDKKFDQLWAVDASRDEERLPRQLVLLLDTPAEGGGTLRVYLRHRSEFGGQSVGHFRLSVTSSQQPDQIVKISARLRPVLEIDPGARTEKQKNDLAEYFRANAPSLKAARDRLKKLHEERDDLGIVSTLILRERDSFDRPSTFMRSRGEFLSKGDRVWAGVPAVLHPMPQDAMPNRLGLAKWLVSPENPLTARVTVNRIWELYFGRGLVETSEDFGTQGERPTHPELLDWLATQFMEQKWSLKAMDRLIVNSSTYRQSSRVAPELVERDPYNRLLARGPRFRVEAEMIRDIALSASGLLSPKIGGPSVFPYQPDGIWDLPYNDDKWEESKGEDQYRRGLYTFARRTAPYPSFLTFDSTSREFCTVRRVRTNTPLQALTALNDPAFFEAAQALARRIIREAPQPDVKSRAVYGFKLCVSRAPKAGELDRILSWYKKERQYFEKHPGDAAKVAAFSQDGNGDAAGQAAWTMVSNVLLNLDETITKE